MLRILAAALLALAAGRPLDAQVLRKGPYLVYPNANTRMQILWQLDATAACRLEWGTDPSYGASVTTTEYGKDHQHSYTITGLTPATRYHYRVTAPGESRTGSFTAAPQADAANLKFLVFGDTRSFPADQDAVCARMIAAYRADPAFQTLALHVGDWVYSGDSEDDWTEQFFPRSYPNILALQADLPILGCRGNHEQTGTLFRKYWPYPHVTRSGFYWSFDYGPAHVAIVDQYTDYAPGSAQYTWLENDLASSGKPWKFIVLHEPGWSARGGHPNNTDVQERIQPLCLAYGVQIVFGGHNHFYARCEVEGVQHITTGGGGAPLRTPRRGAPGLVVAEGTHHFCEVEIQGGTLTCTVRRRNGTVIESFSLSTSAAGRARPLRSR